MSNKTSCPNADGFAEEHVTFEEMAGYIFDEDMSSDFFKTAARINKHVAECGECYQMYNALYTLHESLDEHLNAETAGEKIRTQVFELLWSARRSEPAEKLAAECGRFQHWLSLEINTAKELIHMGASGFAHPKLVTTMKSSTENDNGENTESIIRSSLSDEKNNRVSIGLDGTLSLYFNILEHPAGQRVILLPDNPEAAPQMAALDDYDSSISYVRFEGICPGQYTIVVER